LSLSLLIILHELGHIPAKLFKTRVEKFYLFFDVKYSISKENWRNRIRWLVASWWLCKISGMIDEHGQRTDGFATTTIRISKPTWQRLIIMLGGVTVDSFWLS
jgi:regulator of sigma E protease